MASADRLLDRELKEAREREADYRGRLARHRELAQKLRLHAAALREALRGPSVGSGNLTSLLADVARLSGQALAAPRTGIWLFDEARENLVCRLQLYGGGEPGEAGAQIVAASCPGYIAAILETDLGAVAVDDAVKDPRTRDLADYLGRHRIGALLDIPIQGPGALHGVVCHEHQGGPRVWQEEEIEFATQVGQLVALALEAERRIQAEQTARGTAAKYQHLVESLPVTVYSFQARSGQLDYVSPRIRDLGGLAPDQYLVAGGIDRWVEAIEPEYREPIRKRLAASDPNTLDGEVVYPIRLPDGTRRWVRDQCAVVRDARGRAFAVQGTLGDVTALREAELAREQIESRYRALLENVDLLAVILDATGRVEFVNDCFVRLTGYARHEALGADGFDLIIVESERELVRTDFLKSIRRGLLASRFETSVRTRAGATRRILWTNTLLRNPAGQVTGSSSLGVDITARLQSEASLLEHQKLESLGRLAATVAHDFNNLLSVIGGAAGTMDSGPAAVAEARRQIEAAVTQSIGLTRSLLAYARHEPIAPALINADEVITPILPMLGTLAGPAIALSHDLAVPEARVVMDVTQLRQVLTNLVGNAADATRGHGARVRISTHLVELELDQARAQNLIAEGTFLVLTVADDGRGMDRSLLERAFDPFFTTKGKGEGTGLGLAMCASIVQRAGGFISVDTSPGEGAAFRVHLPVADHAGPARVSSPAVAEKPAVSGRAATEKPRVVLVVEDVEPIRNLMARVLSARGVRVLEAPDLATARRVLAEPGVDLLLVDGRLPDGSGAALIAEVRARGAVRRVVLISGSVGDTTDLPVDAVVAKPFRPAALVETVLRLLASD